MAKKADTPQTYPVEVRKDEAAGLYLFGITLDGAFVAFGSSKIGHVDSAIADAKAGDAGADAESE